MNKINHRQICLKVETLKMPIHNKIDLVGLKKWTKHLIELLGMKIIIGPNFHYVDAVGNEGWTGGCNIETSHFAMHWWEKPKLKWLNSENKNAALLQADIYTCGKLGKKQIKIILESLKIFDPIYVEYILIDREKHIILDKAKIYKKGLLKQ